MYRILSASQDGYITNKIISGQRVINSNTGHAATIDIFKLFDETKLSGSFEPIELSRGLVKFDYEPLLGLTSSILSPTNNNFKAFLSLKSVYGGQTTPRNFTLKVNPVAKSWSEGLGLDVLAFSDLDAANWITASVNPNVVAWTVTGSSSSGSLGDVCDYYVSGNIGFGSQSLEKTQVFPVGDEDLLVDVTDIVSASIWGNIPNNGFRVSFIDNQEEDRETRFVKRFGSRNAKKDSYHPKLLVKYSGNVIADDILHPRYNLSNNFFVYNDNRGVASNFVSGTSLSEVTGTNCLLLELVASRSNPVLVTSWSQSHSQSITFQTTSVSYFSQSFTGSQVFFGTLPQRGIYTANALLNTVTNPELNSFVSGGNTQTFALLWKSLDGTQLYTSGASIKFVKELGSNSSFDPRNYVVNVINLQQEYKKDEHTRLRVFIQDWEFNFSTQKLPKAAISRVFDNMLWSVIDSYSREVVIPFDELGTKLSSDGMGMYFDFWFSDLPVGKVYEFEFKLQENGRTETVSNQGFRFKITS